MKNTLRFFKKITPMLALAAIMMAPMWGWGQYAGTGTFTKITSVEALTDGYYVILNESDEYVMTNGRSGSDTTGYFVSAEIIPSGGTITDPSVNNVWKIETNGTGKTIYNESIAKYVGWSSGNSASIEDVPANTNRWTFTYESSKFTVNNVATPARQLSYNSSHPRFAAYGNNGQQELQLYKMGSAPTGPAILLTPTSLSDFTYVLGSGPSTEQTFTVSGSNLTADIGIAATTNYEISKTSGSGYTTPLTFTQTGGTVTETTVYVRLKAGLSAGDYNDEDIAATSTDATARTVTCSGTVTPPATPEPTNHATNFIAGTATPAYSAIDVVWDDATGATVPDGYVIKASDVSYAAIAEPVDGVEETAGLLVKVVAPGVQVANFTGLNPEQTYYFKIWPYTNSGATIDYKTDGVVPQDDATTAAAPPVPAIYFTEYIEGSSNNKAIEIYNGTGSAIDLSLLTVNNYANGSATVSNTITGKGNLNPGATFVIGNSGADTGITGKADTTSTVTYFNGDDAVELVYNGQTVDIIGVIGTDPGSAWNVAGTANATANQTLIRKLNITTGNTNWATSAGTDANDSEWVVKEADYFANLSYVGTVWQGTTTAWADEANWDMGVPSIYQAWVVAANEYPIVSTTETISDLFVLDNDLHIAPTGHLNVTSFLGFSGPGIVTVEPLGKLEGEVLNLGTADLLVVQSDASGTGSVITDWNSKATIQRYLTGGWDAWDAGWHQISSPVAAQPIADFATGNYDFYGWDEATNMWMNYKDGGFSGWNGGTNFNVGQGYLVSYEAANTTQTFTGELNTADVTIENMSNGGASYNGWHLLGNPFASALIWNDANWYLDEVAGNAKIWHETNKSYSDIAPNGIIPSAQGFMVQVNSAANGIIIPEASRVHDPQPFYKAGTEQLLLVAAETEGGSAQESKIMVNPMATEGFDFDYDSRFLAGYAPQLYSIVGDELLSTNSLPDLTSGKVIPLGFVKNAATAFTIELKEGIAGRVVYLTDNKTNTVTNLTETPVYSFTSEEGDDANRFLLSFGTLGIDNPTATDGIQVYAYGDVLYLATSTKEAALVNVYNLTGQLVMQAKTGGDALSTFNASKLGNGVYVVNVISSEGVVSQKVVIRK